jgi:hypothetical protein
MTHKKIRIKWIEHEFSMDVWTLTNKVKGVRKKDLAQWVSLIFGKTLTPPNICKGFKSIGI